MEDNYKILGINMNASKEDVLNAFAIKVFNAHGEEKERIVNAYSMINNALSNKKSDSYDFDLDQERVYVENLERLYKENSKEINAIEVKNKIELLKAKKDMVENNKRMDSYKLQKLDSYIQRLKYVYASLVPRNIKKTNTIKNNEVDDIKARDLVIYKDSLEYKKTLSKGSLKLQRKEMY